MTEPSSSGRESASGQPGLVLGAILVIVGLILFAGQMVDIGIGDIGWPVWPLAVGVAIMLVGLFVLTEAPIVVMGTIVTTAGAVLLYQESTGNYQTWAYAWALVGPAASGLGMILWGLRSATPARCAAASGASSAGSPSSPSASSSSRASSA